MRKLVSLLLLIIFGLFLFIGNVRADEIENLQKQIGDLQHQLDLSKNATTPLESQVKDLEAQLNSIHARLSQLQADLAKSEADLATQRKILAATVRSFYIGSFVDIPLLTLFSSGDATEALRNVALQQETSREDKNIIADIAGKIAKLAAEKKSLAALSAQVSQQDQFFKGEIAKAKSFQSQLEGQIASLTARQQEIINAKSGTFTTSVGEVPLPDDPNASPSYSPGFSPAFGGFSFGAYSHRNGMSQYGAKGRADGGQGAEDILGHYFPGATLNKNYSEPSTITVTGYGSMPFEDQYMNRIYEMPSDWSMEALKAQAVAARTYAIRQGGTICPTESCQVYKDADKPDRWKQAVTATRGWVLEGGPNAQYSSTTGGYLNNSGWDTKCGGRDCWTPDAYEKIAGSPWFYKGWYTQTYYIGSASCGRNSPWLTGDEMADILNAYLVRKAGGGDQGRITPVTTGCWGGNPYSISDLRDLANSSAGGAVSSVSSVSVSYSNDGVTASVIFNTTNRGSISIPGSDFKNTFNLRAPGYISIRSPLFNVEQK